jgi:hypothetical protein
MQGSDVKRTILIASVRQYYAVPYRSRTSSDRAAYRRLRKEDPELADQLDELYRINRINDRASS